jgi:hypothetical protein
MALDAIDVNLVVDAASDDVVGQSEEWLAQQGLSGAWLTAVASRYEDPTEHDERLEHACAETPSLHVLPVLVPPTAGPGVYARARRLAADGSRVVRLCPGSHHYPLADWVLSPLPELCERAGQALMLDFEPGPVRWEETVAFARTYPSLPMIVLEVQIGGDRVLPAALDVAPNLLVHVGRLHSLEDLVHLVRIYGASRFLWGSSLHPGQADALPSISEAQELDDESRASVLRANARALQDGRYAEAIL